MSLVGNVNMEGDDPSRATAQAASRLQHGGEIGREPSYSSESSPDEIDEKAQEEERASRIQSLARQLTTGSTAGPVDLFHGNRDPQLDPSSEDFNPKAWYRALFQIFSRDPEKFPQRTAGIAFRNLGVYGFGTPTDYQKDVGNVILGAVGIAKNLLGIGKRKIQILRNFEGLLDSGEMLVVLGRPGSGCSTLLKTISGETYGFQIDSESYINYQGISAKQMHGQFRGEAIYTAETDVHFPQLTVGQTLSFAARARAPRHSVEGLSQREYSEHMKDVMMAMFGLTHTVNTRVGNDFIRGVSGGERKRVSISEAALSGSPMQCWDNSTRGLDSANAIEFCKTLRLSTELAGTTACVAIYQAPQSAYDIFDKVIVLYEGRQIYFGHTTEAKEFFTNMGFECPDRQTTADFLTSLTSPAERIVRPGYENRVPRTPDEFAAAWQNSPERAQLLRDIEEYERRFPIGGEHYEQFVASRRAQQAKHQSIKSPYTLSVPQQVALCMDRGFQRLRGDMSLTLTSAIGNCIMALVIGSVFYNLHDDTGSFYYRGALLFFAILMNAFASFLEILTLYAQRPIVEKHARYALYHPFAEAISSMLCDLPNKIITAIVFNLTLYFLTNLRRTPSAFFIFFLFNFVVTLTMSMLFRTIGSLSKTLAQAMAPAALLILALIIFTGFTIPTRDMLGWSRWINYLDPIAYAFESLMVNEFHHRRFPCAQFIPSMGPYDHVGALNHVCSTTGSVPGQGFVEGDAYINTSFKYYRKNLWRNLGILFAFMVFFCGVYLFATEYVAAQKSKGEVLLFRRGHKSAVTKKRSVDDEESAEHVATSPGAAVEKGGHGSEDAVATIQKQTAVFHWSDVCYDIKIKGQPRRILDNVDGWVKPGTLTALMGVSGAGKTTLLDVLATRVTMGVVSGEMLVDGQHRDASFQRKTGYVQQQDLHLATSTVREALNFSALLRQPASTPRAEKLAYVTEVIKLLEMEEYADAVVGVPGEGLNVEQRKRLTIAVELVAKPQLLLFLDEPTSGLDSQTSWSICDLMEKLTKHGQAILCTIHQPSAMLFQRFDRLLFLAKGGRTVYFGEIGKNSSTLTNYFEKNGASPCPPTANPAEWMLEVIGAAPGSHSDVDWPVVWNESPEHADVKRQLAEMKEELPKTASPVFSTSDKLSYREFAAPFSEQFMECSKRVFSQYWRTPNYIYSKLALCIFTALFIGFSFFNAPNSMQGLQNQMFAIFMLMTIFGNLVQQIMPHFVTQRALYEARERPAKCYSWKAFMLSNILVELPWQTLMAVIMFFCWYYPIGMYRNAIPTHAVHERGALMFLYIWVFLLFTSTFTHMIVAGIELAETAGNVAQLLFSLTLIFCGVLAGPTVLPGFWIFMYRVSPFTYMVSGILSTGVGNTKVVCSDIELVHFEPLSGQSCGQYMKDYIRGFGGYLTNPDATSGCNFCQVSETNIFLKQVSSDFSDRWRNFGLMWVYVIFNIAAALFLYWLARVPKKSRGKKKEE
ncbi:putative ABC transporter [Xylona heveae TC161]|uniref:Putative ABC transporter n=1 Tax=Xylona heveae (strain CBS 132557 / TC161) TaxID=1328760 RepID=A0A165HQS1_XYLHT|nr:putative ABC transporter [Xylona heveae TC161]KZF23845.1 putative ABC transporter [Xylona heveae TC161]